MKKQKSRKSIRKRDLSRAVPVSEEKIRTVLSAGKNYEFYKGDLPGAIERISSIKNMKGLLFHARGTKKLPFNMIEKLITSICNNKMKAYGWSWELGPDEEPFVTVFMVMVS